MVNTDYGVDILQVQFLRTLIKVQQKHSSFYKCVHIAIFCVFCIVQSELSISRNHKISQKLKLQLYYKLLLVTKSFLLI